MRLARERLDQVEVDRTRVKPMVKITGEFWAQLTEGDGNFNMFAFLEREGAQVLVEPIGCWITYLLYQARASTRSEKGPGCSASRRPLVGIEEATGQRVEIPQEVAAVAARRRHLEPPICAHRPAPGRAHAPSAPQSELARLAHPFYHSLARGGEGHLEVGKNVYYTTHGLCHMVLALKPFGCMPSSQSDGVQSAVVNRFPEMIFLPIETSGEGEINAHSRVQMALGEAKIKAKAEFEQALASTGKKLDEIREYAAEHRQLRSPFYPVPRRRGVAGVAANFVLHVSELMDGKARLAKVPGETMSRDGDMRGDSVDTKRTERRPNLQSAMSSAWTSDRPRSRPSSSKLRRATDRILWHDYQRHDTRQPEKLLEFLQRMEAEIGVAPGNCRMFITGSGGNALSA